MHSKICGPGITSMPHCPTRQRYLARQRSSERLQTLDSHKPFLKVKTSSRCCCCWLADPGTLAPQVQYLPRLQPLATNVGRVVWVFLASLKWPDGSLIRRSFSDSIRHRHSTTGSLWGRTWSWHLFHPWRPSHSNFPTCCTQAFELSPR